MTRTLAHILTDINEVQEERRRLDRKCMLVPVGSFQEDELSDQFAAADDRLLELQAEAIAKIHELTGVRWSAIERAML